MRRQKLTKEDREMLNRIAGVIRAHLRGADMTRDKLADKAGVARATLFQIIRGKSNVRVGNLHKIAKAMGHASLSDFLRTVDA